jgi:pimeloyl-ACP methyl ester carboxylesterase
MAMRGGVRVGIRLDVTAAGVPGCRTLAADVVADPERLGPEPVVLVCLPGGGMSRRYFDLEVPGGCGSFSMTRALAAAGLVVVTLDHPGVGESDVPDDAWSLTPEVVADVDAVAVHAALDGVRAGTIAEGLPPLPGLRSIGVGHSMGALLTVYQQARHRTHAALGLLGFGAGGMGGGDPEVLRAFLTEDELRFVGDGPGLRREIVHLAAARFGAPLPTGSTAASDLLLAGMPVPEEALAALGASASSLLALCGLTSMITGTSAAELAAVDVPVFVGVGEHDITGEPRVIPQAFTGSGDLTVFVLPGAGHNHNVAPNRHLLWARLASWCREVTLP